MADEMTVLHAGDYGYNLILVAKKNGSAQDISSASTFKIHAYDPVAKSASTWTAALNSDGTDGKFKYAITDGDIPSTSPGSWTFQGEIDNVHTGKTVVVVEDVLA